MLKQMIITVAAVTLVAVGAGRAAAHHGWSRYDSGKPLHLTGTILDSGYEHPHGYLHLGVPGKTWLVVLAPPSHMENRGLPRTMLQAGTVASVEGDPNRNDPNEMRAERITIDGRTVELR